MMTPKAYRDPTETLTTYALASVGGALAASAVDAPDPSLLAYPIYYCIINAATAILLHRRRAALTGPPAAWIQFRIAASALRRARRSGRCCSKRSLPS